MAAQWRGGVAAWRRDGVVAWRRGGVVAWWRAAVAAVVVVVMVAVWWWGWGHQQWRTGGEAYTSRVVSWLLISIIWVCNPHGVCWLPAVHLPEVDTNHFCQDWRA